MTQKIKITVYYKDEVPFDTSIEATDRIAVLVDENGISVRSDGERLELPDNKSDDEEVKVSDFSGQMTLFDNNPWQMNI